jgi:hypothetical protein
MGLIKTFFPGTMDGDWSWECTCSANLTLFIGEQQMNKFTSFVLYVSSIVLAIGIGMHQTGDAVGEIGAAPVPCDSTLEPVACGDAFPDAKKCRKMYHHDNANATWHTTLKTQWPNFTRPCLDGWCKNQFLEDYPPKKQECTAVRNPSTLRDDE